jgi:hypothetical protein
MEKLIIQLMGGLGNMMFQVATAYATSLRDNKNFFCDKVMSIIPHKHYTHYTTNIFREINFIDKDEEYNFYNEGEFSYNKIPKIEGNVELNGYFQSEKYFVDFRDEVLSLFSPNYETKNKIDSFFQEYSKIETCSIHVRRGDYVGLKDFHENQSLDYYIESVKNFNDDTLFLIFSDDINWCKENFNFIKNKIFISDFLDFEQLYLMSLCNHNIIANSTFSWWGAWLNKNDNKKIICPKKWFGDSNSHINSSDIYCNKWLII